MKLPSSQILLVIAVVLGMVILAKNYGYLNWTQSSYQPSNNNPPTKPPEVTPLPQTKWTENFELERLK